MMRQAGRYLPEYRATRAKAGDFLSLCKDLDFTCEVTLQPLDRFPLDAAILFSDILTIPDAMGLGLYFCENEGPKFKKPIRTQAAIDAINVPDPEEKLGYVIDAIKIIRRELDGKVPLIGFSGSPWTLATYMIEGGSTKNFSVSKSMLFKQPKMIHSLLNKLANAVIIYLNAQINAGAQVIMLFDTWGGILTPQDYKVFSLNYMMYIISNLNKEHKGYKVPIIIFTKGGSQWLEIMTQSGADALGLDWTINIGDARQRVGDKVALQGNMDPCVLHSSPDRIRKEVKYILKSFGKGSGHVFNLGHGIHPNTPTEHVAAFVEAVHEFSPCWHN